MLSKGKKTHTMKPFGTNQVKDTLRNMHCGLSPKLLNHSHPNGNLKNFILRFYS